ncbi:MAG TPA: GNAT family N-acetyltransferase [Bacteroidales bacterium]|nr:GNAT family N-acetyltransferase [Bacteroidales bacterium]HPS17695.1 GNAT family N-acetyltransferase [Bacteroidales bacterium]
MNPELETKRLKIIPLTYEQLDLYVQTNYILEEQFNLTKAKREIPPELIAALNKDILPAVADDKKNYLFFTLWIIIDKVLNQMVADICFKGEPNDKGEVEIGYGTYDAFKGKGYMTEAIEAIANWAFRQPNIKSIIAETQQTNLASHRVLVKNNFKLFNKADEMIWWKLEQYPR